MDEVQTAATLVQSVVDYSANIIFGACIDQNINDELEVPSSRRASRTPITTARRTATVPKNRNFIVNRGLNAGGAAGSAPSLL